MELFEFIAEPGKNLLPCDGEVYYYGKLLDAAEAQHYFNLFLKNTPWQNDEVLMNGKRITTKRKIAWYAEDKQHYTYSKITKKAHLWTPELIVLRDKIQDLTGEKFNSCLLNLYPDGSEGMGYHCDAEGDLQKDSAIASLSLGASRKFVFKHKTTKSKIEIYLHSGSLLLMKGATQRNWQHALPPTMKVNSPRINLTFRRRVPRSEP